MKDINGKEIRRGQRVRWTWAETHEGVVEDIGSSMSIRDDGGLPHRGLALTFFCNAYQKVTIEVLAEPRIPEPLGIGAVVRDACGGMWVRVDDEDEPWRRHNPVDTASRYRRYDRWDNLTDPVLLSEGWSGDE